MKVAPQTAVRYLITLGDTRSAGELADGVAEDVPAEDLWTLTLGDASTRTLTTLGIRELVGRGCLVPHGTARARYYAPGPLMKPVGKRFASR